MFGRILDVNTTRTTGDAVGFYVLSLIMLVGFSTLLVHVLTMLGLVSASASFFEGSHIHTLIGTGFVLVVSSLILTGRKLTGDLFSILLVAVAVYLAYTTNVMLGMIPVAILTTLHHKETV